jgi:hypothetical protein
MCPIMGLSENVVSKRAQKWEIARNTHFLRFFGDIQLIVFGFFFVLTKKLKENVIIWVFCFLKVHKCA